MLKVNRAKRVLQINRVSKILLKRTGPKEHLKNYKEDVRIVTLSLSLFELILLCHAPMSMFANLFLDGQEFSFPFQKEKYPFANTKKT